MRVVETLAEVAAFCRHWQDHRHDLPYEIDDVDRTALIDETARFPGADLLHTTFDDATLRRIEDALSRADGSRADGS